MEHEEVNRLLKEALEILTGKDSDRSYIKTQSFPNLPPLTPKEIMNLAEELKINKAIANDLMTDTEIITLIRSDAKYASIFSGMWTESMTSMKKHLTGRLILLNKAHPKIPLPTEMRPIIALSPLLKLLEIRFKPKLDLYLNNRLTRTQTGFVQKCGTQINILRVLERCYFYKNTKYGRACIFFLDLKSAYNNVPLESLFKNLITKAILEPLEVEFLRALYSNTTITIGEKQTLQINKGVMQGSVLSPALFDFFFEELIIELTELHGETNVFAYADDLAAICTSFAQLHHLIDTIDKWSKDNSTPINYGKSGILNILKNCRSRKMVGGGKFRDYPIKKEYKYLGIWINETLDPKYHLYHPKVADKREFIERRLKWIPKKAVSPAFIINLWTLLVRPLFDYAILHAMLSKTKFYQEFLRTQRGSFKNVLGIRDSVETKVIEGLMGYSPLEFGQEMLEQA